MIRSMLRRTSFNNFDPDYQAVLNFATSNSISKPNNFIQIGQNQLMIDLKSFGLFSKLDVFHCFVDNTTTNEDFKHICWKRVLKGEIDLGSGGSSGNYEFQGWRGNSTARFNTKFNFSLGSNYTLNDACYGSVLFSQVDNNLSSSLNSNQNSFLLTNSTQKRINSAFTNLNSAVNAAGETGLISISRYSSTNVSVFIKSTEFARTQNSSSLPNFEYITNGLNAAGSDNIMSFCFAGSSLTATEYTNFRTALNDYLTYLGLTAFA